MPARLFPNTVSPACNPPNHPATPTPPHASPVAFCRISSQFRRIQSPFVASRLSATPVSSPKNAGHVTKCGRMWHFSISPQNRRPPLLPIPSQKHLPKNIYPTPKPHPHTNRLTTNH
jgi:hypothetical protein